MKTDLTLPSDVTRQASLLYEGLGTPVAVVAAAMLRERDWDGLAQLSVKPSSYTSPLRYFCDASAAALLKKLQQLPSNYDKRARAIEKWWEGERDCYRTNRRLNAYMPENRVFTDPPQVSGISELISEIRKIIHGWLGSRPPDLLLGKFGPGATYSDRGGKATVPDKMSSDPTLTRDAVWFLPQWLGTQWGAALAQRHGELSFVRGNRFSTVPKTALIDRGIASEPSINVFYQLALGRALRERLRRVGWDLDIAEKIHQQVAEKSSVSLEFATLDLSNASDTVSKELVRLLLPHDWYEALADLRSPATYLDGKWVVLEKFSSMGNGYTFELETIIFAAITCAVCRKAGHEGMLGRDVFVFGDDIICKDGFITSMTAVLSFFGFSLNKEKSFHGHIPFRESCGGDYFSGMAVRPFYLKELPNEPQEFIAFANGLHALNERVTRCNGVADLRAWFSVLDSLPTWVRRCRGPKDLGDVVVHDDYSRWETRWRNGIRYVRAWKPMRPKEVSWNHFHADVVLACATYGTGAGNSGPLGRGTLRVGGVIPRDPKLSYRCGWVAYS